MHNHTPLNVTLKQCPECVDLLPKCDKSVRFVYSHIALVHCTEKMNLHSVARQNDNREVEQLIIKLIKYDMILLVACTNDGVKFVHESGFVTFIVKTSVKTKKILYICQCLSPISIPSNC